jgi:uncharacterized surface protein with fasciclin (FAS1) repeats
MVTRRTIGLAASAVALAAGGATLLRPTAAAARTMTLLDVVNVSRDLSRFAGLVKAAGLEGELSKPGQFGLFAPHNPYFESFHAPTMETLVGDLGRLRRVLLRHITTKPVMVYPGGLGSERGGDLELLRTVGGDSVAVWNGGGGQPRIEGRVIWVANVAASNGIAHCIDGLIGGWTA